MLGDTNAIAALPLLVVEDPLPGQGAFDHNCRDEGGIHVSRRIKKVHVFETAPCGIYLGRNFASTPHYNIPEGEYSDFLAASRSKGFPITRYSSEKNIV